MWAKCAGAQASERPVDPSPGVVPRSGRTRSAARLARALAALAGAAVAVLTGAGAAAPTTPAAGACPFHSRVS